MTESAGVAVDLRFGLFLGVLGGCRPTHPLPEVPIDGGTPEQRAIVREELLGFDTWVGAGRVELRSFGFEDVSDEPWNAWYDHERRRVVIGQHHAGVPLRVVVRHELCHALGTQDRLLVTRMAAFDLISAKIVDEDDLPTNAPRHKRGEVLARLCEHGPAPTLLMATACPGDTGGLGPLGDYLIDQVWLGDPELDPEVLPVGESVAVPWAGEAERMKVTGSHDGALASIKFERDGFFPDLLLVDLETGVPVHGSAWPGPDDADLGSEAPPLPTGLKPVWHDEGWAYRTVDQGAREAVIVRPAHDADFGSLAFRVVVRGEDEVWRSVADCPASISAVFSTPGRLWTASLEDGEVRWAPILGL